MTTKINEAFNHRNRGFLPFPNTAYISEASNNPIPSPKIVPLVPVSKSSNINKRDKMA
jgi:hypothetical protein